MYKALIQFRDTDGAVYDKGGSYPRGNVSQARIQQLLTANNKTNAPVIVAIELPSKDANDFSTMTRAQMEAIAEENGIDLTGATTNAQRRELLQNGTV